MIRQNLILATLVAALPGVLRAELIPPFSMTYCTDQAKLIAIGKLDGEGKLTITRVLSDSRMRGTAEIPGAMAVQLRSAMGVELGEPIDAMVFLNKDDRPIWGAAGLVGFDEQAVFVLRDGLERSAGYVPHPALRRAGFIKRVEATIAVCQQRRHLTSLKPSRDRARQLLEFALVHDHTTPDGFWPNYHLRQIAAAMKPAHPDESAELLSWIEAAETDDKRAKLLLLAERIPLGRDVYDDIAKWLSRKHAPQVRIAAMQAITAIDNSQASESLRPLVSMDEPLIREVLQCLTRGSGSNQGVIRSPALAETLLDFTRTMRERHRRNGRTELQNESYQLLTTLQVCFHPKMLPLLRDWAFRDDHVTSNQALSNLQTILGIEFSRDVPAVFDAWWEKAESVLKVEYELGTAEGIAAFLNEYPAADKTTRKLLDQLWMFQTEIPVDNLLAKAKGKEASIAAAAKHALSHLWQQRRLTPDIRERIVKEFLRVELVERRSGDERHELAVVGHRSFPFPRDAWVQPTGSIELTPRLPKLSKSWGAFSLHDGPEPLVLASMGTGRRQQRPSANAIVALREVNHQSGNVLWQLEWKIGPLELRRKTKQ